MQLKQFPHIEDYVLFLNSRIDATGNPFAPWTVTRQSIFLNAFDKKFISDMSDIVDKMAFLVSLNAAKDTYTDKQANLILRIIGKYKSQLEKEGIEIPTHRNFRSTIRIVDRSTGLSLVNDKLHLRFPFQNMLIEQLRAVAKVAQGEVKWDIEARVWSFALTEYNVSWAVAFAEHNKIEVDEAVQELFAQIVEIENGPSQSIKLVVNENHQLEIENVPQSMLDYFASRNIDTTDIYAMVDCAGELCYEVSDDIKEVLTETDGKQFVELCTEQSVGSKQNFEAIVQWAIKVNRLPIVVYNPVYAKHDTSVEDKYFLPNEIQIIKSSGKTIDPTAKFVYTTTAIEADAHTIPVLVSYANLMHGKNKKSLLNAARKVVYHCETLPKT
jgi:hypothetical protein